MNRLAALLAAFLALAVVCAVALDEPSAEVDSAIKGRSLRFVEALRTGQVISIRDSLSPGVAKSLTREGALQIFGGMAKRGGKLTRTDEPHLQRRSDDSVVSTVGLVFERESYSLRLLFESHRSLARVVHFEVQPYTPPPSADKTQRDPAADPPPYAEPMLYREEKVSLAIGKLGLPAIVTLPLSASATTRVPAAVLSASGTSGDIDGTLGAARAWRDIACGLATQGVASIRYESRRHLLAAEGLDGGDMDDAEVDCAAARFVSARPEVDPARAFLVAYAEDERRVGELLSVSDACTTGGLALLGITSTGWESARARREATGTQRLLGLSGASAADGSVVAGSPTVLLKSYGGGTDAALRRTSAGTTPRTNIDERAVSDLGVWMQRGHLPR